MSVCVSLCQGYITMLKFSRPHLLLVLPFFNTPQFGGATNGETVEGEVGVNSNYSTTNFSNRLFTGE